MLYNLANNSVDRKTAIVDAGAVAPLVKLMVEGTEPVRKEALDTLRILTVDNAKTCVAIVAEGAAARLAQVLKSDLADERKKATMLRDSLLKHGGAGVKAALQSAKAAPA